jgi:hypothetical protein
MRRLLWAWLLRLVCCVEGQDLRNNADRTRFLCRKLTVDQKFSGSAYDNLRNQHTIHGKRRSQKAIVLKAP